MIDEQRKNPRIELEQMLYLNPGKDQNIYAKVKEISESGLSFISQDPVEPDNILEISIFLNPFDSDKHKIILKGKVIYCCEIDGIYNCGLEFTLVNEKYKKILKKFIESQSY